MKEGGFYVNFEELKDKSVKGWLGILAYIGMVLSMNQQVGEMIELQIGRR